MIAACPKCQTRYRVEPGKLGADGARLRCSQCSAVFRVRLPADPAPPAEAVATGARALVGDAAGGVAQTEPELNADSERIRVAASSQPVAAESRSAAERPAGRSQSSDPRAEAPDTAPRFDRARLVLLAHPNPDTCKRVAEALEREGLQVLVAHDGVEAILTVQRTLPRAVVLDAALPKMFGFQVCELIKRNESLRVTHVCLIGAIHREDRYRRAPSEIYGADFYLETPALPDGLIEWLGRTGFELGSRGAPAPAAPTSEPRPAIPPETRDFASEAKSAEPSGEPQARAVPGSQAGMAEPRTAPAPQKPATEAPQPKPIGRIGVAADPLAAERAQAERLARIIVSDIVLYNEEKFSAAVRSGGVLETMRDELAEGRTLFRERIDVQVRDERDFLADELMRVARSRGAS